MGVWRKSRAELAGAWRSLRYDLGRRTSEPPADDHDVTSTGMNTFGGTAWDSPFFSAEPIEMPVAGRMPPPRGPSPAKRAAAVSTFGLLTVIGAAGAYLVVVNGLVPVRDEAPAAAGTLPPAAATKAEARIGRSPRVPRPARKTVTETTRPKPEKPQKPEKSTVAAPRPPQKASPIRTTEPANPICCVNPPVPTPTAPGSPPSPTPSATRSPSASAPSSDIPGRNLDESPEQRSLWQLGQLRLPG